MGQFYFAVAPPKWVSFELPLTLHELYEFAGALLLGEGERVLFIRAGDLDQWDTQKDILNNLIGGVIGVIFDNYQIMLDKRSN